MSLRRTLASSFANYFLLFVTWAILSPFLPLYLKARGFAPSRIGILLAVFELAGVSGSLIIARLADRRSAYRELLGAGLLLAALSFLPLQLTTVYPLAALSIVIMGLSYRSTAPLLDGLVTRVVPDPVHSYGRLRVAGSLGFIFISVALQVSGLVTGDSAPAILIAFSASAVVAAAAAMFLPGAPAPIRPGPWGELPRARGGFAPRFWAIIAVIFLGRFGIGAYYSFFSLYLKHTFPDAGVSMLWAIGAGAEVLTVWFSGPLLKRWGMRTLLIVSLAAISVRLGLFVVAPTIAVVAAAQVLHAFTFGTFHTTSVAYVSANVASERRGLGMAIYNALCIGLSTVLASAAGGYIVEARGFTVLFVTYAVFPLLGILILAVFGRGLLSPDPAGRPRALRDAGRA